MRFHLSTLIFLVSIGVSAGDDSVTPSDTLSSVESSQIPFPLDSESLTSEIVEFDRVSLAPGAINNLINSKDVFSPPIVAFKPRPMFPLAFFEKRNAERLYLSPGYSFYNEYAKKYFGSLSKKTVELMNKESGKCQGFMTLSERLFEAGIEDCFASQARRQDILEGKIDDARVYLSSILLITSIVDVVGRHHCMASYYRAGRWVTAKHCVDDSSIEFGMYLLTPAGLVEIKKDALELCADCDVAFIKIATPVLLEHEVPDTNPDLSLVNPDTKIFLAGIIDKTPLDSGDSRSDYERKLLWSERGKGYCRVRNVFKGCISHTCNSIEGFSGSPLYSYDEKSRRVQLLGIHSGYQKDKVSCAGRDMDAITNYAVLKPLYGD